MRARLFRFSRKGFAGAIVLAASLGLGSAGLRGEPRGGAVNVPPAGFFAGDYALIGRKPDSRETYAGRVRLRESSGGGLEVTRTVNGRTARGRAAFETATADRIPVLRMRFTLDGRRCEGTYLWRSDLDNYLRLTGYVYRLDGGTKSAGLEALFPARD